MKKIILLAILIFNLKSIAQEKKHFGCVTDEHHLHQLNESKDYKEKFERNNIAWQNYALKKLKENSTQKSATNPVTLSVAFHDLSSTGNFLFPTVSISGYQYIIDKLNLIYNGTIGNDTHINFCIAQKDINGNTYTATLSRAINSAAANLDRTNSFQLNQIISASNTLTKFPTKKYINIYIVDNIIGAAGFATLPSSHGYDTDGIYITRTHLIDTNINANINVLVHEMGHYLGLFHTFGICDPSIIDNYPNCSCDNDNCLFNGDMVCDTQPNKLQMTGYNCTPSSFPNTCTDIIPTITDGTHPTTEVSDPKQNYMDYGDMGCQYQFTLGQIQRMNFMIDPEFGPRKSLLGQSECFNCVALDNCIFSIIPNITFPNPRHEIIQVASGTPPVLFNPSMSCTPTTANAVNYLWKLELLGNPNQVIFQNVPAPSYTTTSALVPGNYQLTMTAVLQSNLNCKELTTFTFSIYPMAGNCNLNLPNSNTTTDWINGNWQRTSSENGWVIFNGSYPSGSFQYIDGQPGFDNTAFDVIPLTSGQVIPNDSNFNSISLPTSNINKIIRVGKKSNGGGKAFYAKITIPVTSNNCKYRIWYLGQTEGIASNIAYPFINESTNNDASFGWVCQYKYNSSVNTITSSYNTTIGYTGSNFRYEKNDMVSLKVNSSITDFVNIGGFKRMTTWKYKDIDFSEFVNLSPDTEITLTFFAHSNIANNALQEAYSYYGIECLGGGTPSSFSFDIEDKLISCNSPNLPSCTEIVVPLPKQIFDSYSVNPLYNFTSIKVYKKLATGLYDTNPYPITLLSNNPSNLTRSFTICLDQSDAFYQDFKMVYKTLHSTFEDTFRIYIGFYNNLIDCTDGDKIDTTFHPNIINGDILICGTNNLPSLHLTNTCITEQHTYQWYYGAAPGGTPIDGATNPSLQLTFNSIISNTGTINNLNSYLPKNCNTYYRKTLYKEPYCGNTKVKISDEFHVFNNFIKFDGVSTDNDICLGDTYQMQVSNPRINSYCRIPLHLYNSYAPNNLTFQMFDPISGQAIGNSINFSFNGQINSNGNNTPLNITPNPLVFTFNNINPLTGNYLFVPTSTQSSFPINLLITGTYLGCPVNQMITNYQYINFKQSAQGGSIVSNCTTNAIDNVTLGISNGNIYNWEYSTNGVTFLPISGAPTTSGLPSSIITNLMSLYPTLYIRRVSLGFINCPNFAYSNVIIKTAHPSTIIFNLPSSICNGSAAPVLPTTSSNGIIGNWNVLNASNSASGTYIFTPLSGYCLPNYVYNLTVSNSVIPTFNQIAPICQGGTFTLPNISNNNISGTWSPSINNMQTTTYTFHPSVPTCSNTLTTMTVIVRPNLVPNFNLPSSICKESIAPLLPTISTNGILGSWNPSVISNINSGIYVFTPNNGQCAQSITKNINILTECELLLEWGSDVSCQLSDDSSGIKFDENIVDGPCIRVCENSIIHYTINGNTANIDYTEWNINGGTVLNSNDTSCNIQWGAASYSSIQTIVHYLDGTTKQISRCIEKLNGPNALFGVQPNVNQNVITVCKDNTIVFDNLTTVNNGHDNIYYNWNFGDETSSNEFEPTHVYTQAGNYEVTLTAYNGCSCVGSYSMTVKVEEGMPQIQCPTIVCEGERATYSLPYAFGEICHPAWSIEGGTLVYHNENNTQIDIIWDDVDESGYGTVTASAPGCFKCTSTIKVPVVKNIGTIVGSNVLCEKSQGLYALPQWATTEFNWTLDDGGTDAALIQNNQRNEIIIRTNYTGTIILRCTYKNTLLGCGGTAEFSIFVKPTAFLEGNKTTCINTPETYNFTSQSGTISNINWIITGSNNFSESGNGTPFTYTFTEPGIYTISVDDENYCGRLNNTITVQSNPIAPTTINGSSFICPGIPVSYSCIVPENTLAHWEVENGEIIGSAIGSEIVANFNPTATTPYLVKVWFEKEGCISTTFIKTVTREIPVLTFTQMDNSVCGSSVQTYTIHPVNVDNYIWSISPANAGSIQSGQNTNSISILWNQEPSNAVVKVEVRKCGATYVKTYNVNVISHPDVLATIAPTACLGQNFNTNFTVVGGGGFTNAIWDFGDGTPPVITYYPNNTAVHIYQEPITTSTTFNVTVTINGAGGCIMPVIISKPVVVSPTPIIQLSPMSDLNYCNPLNTYQDYTYTVNIQNGFGYTNTIQWFKNGLPFSTVATITVTNPGTNTDNYYAVVTNNLGCHATTETFSVKSDCDPGCNMTNALWGESQVIDCQKIKVVPTIIQGSPMEVYWTNTDLPGATILQNDATAFIAENVNPGEYSITLNAEYEYNGAFCTKQQNIPVIVPYKAGLKYTVNCTGNNLYTVTLLDHSVFYPNTPIEHFAFTYDGGANWYPATMVGGIPQLTISLAPGNYNVGIKIWNSTYPVCQKMETLNLPAYPIATFTSAPSVCQREALLFTATDTTPGLQYFWKFYDTQTNFSTNLQQNPVKAFATSGNHLVSLTVKNSLGCSATYTASVNVIPNNIAGKLNVNPVSACEGSSVNVYYEALPGTNPVQKLYWYHNEYSATPISITQAPNLSLTVNQPGQYFAYGQNTDGCMEYMKISPASVKFVPGPEAPMVTGPIVSCLSETIHLDVPDDVLLNYVWKLNGELYQWNGDADVYFSPTVEGTYTFEVMAQIQAANGEWCNGETTTHVVTVVGEPVVPQLELHVDSCSPYIVKVTVQNPQAGASYYWSNGDTGTTATITHDGPVQVRVEINGCSVTEQLDLPVDLETLAWIFPKGCMATCFENGEGYILGPFGEFEKWVWYENGNVVEYGNGSTNPLYEVQPINSYEFYLNNHYCEATWGTLNMENSKCEHCKLDYTFKKINCITVNGISIYEIEVYFNNVTGLPLTTTLTAPNGEGYFITSTLTLPNGGSNQTLYFYPNGFTGGTIEIFISGTTDKNNCFLKVEEYLPNCKGKGKQKNEDVISLPKQNVVFVAPNPAQTNTTVHYQLVNMGNVTIELFDATGRNIWQTLEKDNKGAVQINCEKLSSGYYMVVVKQNSEIVHQSKLIIQ